MQLIFSSLRGSFVAFFFLSSFRVAFFPLPVFFLCALVFFPHTFIAFFPPFALLSFLCLSSFSVLWFSFFTPLLHSFLLSRCFLSFACILSLCFGFLSSHLYCILYFFRVELFSAPLFRPIFDLSPSQYTRQLCSNLHITNNSYMFAPDFSNTAYCLPVHASTQDSSYTFFSVCTAPSSTHLHTHHTHA